MELERKYVTLSKQKGHAVSQVTLEEDLNVPDQKPDIFRIVHRQGEFCPDEIKGEAGKVKVRGIFHYRILYIGEGAGHMPELLEGSIPVDEVVFLNDLEEGDQVDFRWSQEDLHASANSFPQGKYEDDSDFVRGSHEGTACTRWWRYRKQKKICMYEPVRRNCSRKSYIKRIPFGSVRT